MHAGEGTLEKAVVPPDTKWQFGQASPMTKCIGKGVDTRLEAAQAARILEPFFEQGSYDILRTQNCMGSAMAALAKDLSLMAIVLITLIDVTCFFRGFAPAGRTATASRTPPPGCLQGGAWIPSSTASSDGC